MAAFPWAGTIAGPSLLEPPPVAAAASDVRHSKLLGSCTAVPPNVAVAVLHGFDDFEERIRKVVGAAYESRNVFIVNLPEILLHRMWTHTAAEVYDRWSECEVIIGKRPRRGRGKNCSPAVGGAHHDVSAADDN